MTEWTLEEEARQAFALSQIYCADCADYHLTRALIKASGQTLGPERDRAVLDPLLQRLASPGARVLIAGAADTGLLSVVLGALQTHEPAITVADRCRTPLRLCALFAASRDVTISTCEADLSASHLGQFDLIIGHVVMNFVAVERRTAFLAHLGAMIAPEGRFVLAANLSVSGRKGPRIKAEAVLAGLAERHVRLPADIATIASALHRQLDTKRDRDRSAVLVDIENHIAEAGLSIEERLQSGPAATSPAMPPSRILYVIRNT